MSEVEARREREPTPEPTDERSGGRRISSASLFGGRAENVITHGRQEYRLILTE